MLALADVMLQRCRIYGFYDECKRRYSIKLWKTFTDCFNCLPISRLPRYQHVCELCMCVCVCVCVCARVYHCFSAAALVENTILCMHGGLSPDLKALSKVWYTAVVVTSCKGSTPLAQRDREAFGCS